MPISKIRPRGDIKNNWETVNPILQLREIGVEWETIIGEGDVKIKFGDGLTHWNDLDYAVVNNITKKIVTALAVVEEEDPELNDGEAVDTLFGKIKKKFQTIQSKITAINTLIGVFEDITIDTGGDSEQAAENITTAINLLNTGKLTTSDIYNGLDSTNATLALSALQGKNLNDAITSLNSDYNSFAVLFENAYNPVAFPGEIDVNIMQYRIVALLLTSSSPLSANRTILVIPTCYYNATYYPVQLGGSLIYVRLQFDESKLTLISSSGTVYVASIYGIVK